MNPQFSTSMTSLSSSRFRGYQKHRATANANYLSLAQRLETDAKCPRTTCIKLQTNWIYFELTEKNHIPGC